MRRERRIAVSIHVRRTIAYEKSMTEVKFIYKNTIDMSLLEESTHSMQKLFSLPTLWSHYPAARGNGNAMVGPIPIGTNLPLSLIIRCIDLFCQYARACWDQYDSDPIKDWAMFFKLFSYDELDILEGRKASTPSDAPPCISFRRNL